MLQQHAGHANGGGEEYLDAGFDDMMHSVGVTVESQDHDTLVRGGGVEAPSLLPIARGGKGRALLSHESTAGALGNKVEEEHRKGGLDGESYVRESVIAGVSVFSTGLVLALFVGLSRAV